MQQIHRDRQLRELSMRRNGIHFRAVQLDGVEQGLVQRLTMMKKLIEIVPARGGELICGRIRAGLLPQNLPQGITSVANILRREKCVQMRVSENEDAVFMGLECGRNAVRRFNRVLDEEA